MTETLLTSSALILFLTLLRYLLRGRISLRLQYGLWLLVVLRLLIPVSFFSSPLSILNASAQLRQSQTIQDLKELGQFSVPVQSFDSAYAEVIAEQEANGVDVSSLKGSALEALDYAAYDKMQGPTLSQMLSSIATGIWLTGAVILALLFFLSNLRFRRKLRYATVLDVTGCPLPVRCSDQVPTPCLVGFIHPTIYLPPECVEDDDRRRHILAHELTHHRHRDGLWALIRCLCLVLYWFDPLVWLAASLSRRDCELACDEGALRTLGDSERTAYGKTLLSLVVPCNHRYGIWQTATTMTAGGLRERISLIAKKPHMAALTLILVIVLAVVAAGCTFTSAQDSSSDADNSLGIQLDVVPDALANQLVAVPGDALETEEAGILCTYYLADDAAGDKLLCEVNRLNQTQFEQEFAQQAAAAQTDVQVSYLGWDGQWFYGLYAASDQSTDEAETALAYLSGWLHALFADQAEMYPITDAPIYQDLQHDTANDSSDAASSNETPSTDAQNEVVSALEELMGGTEGSVTLTLAVGDTVQHYTVPSQAGNGPFFANYFTDIDWTSIGSSDLSPTPLAYDYSLQLASAQDSNLWFRFWENNTLVLRHDASGDHWYQATMPDGGSIAAWLRQWYDEAEFQAILDTYAVYTTESRDFDEIALSWGDALANAWRRVTPGSISAVKEVSCIGAEVYDTDEGDDTQFCFNLTLALAPEAPNTVYWMAGAGIDPISDGPYAGQWTWSRQVLLRRDGNTWKMVEWGGGVTL
jgi:beta-lactamase regulating signal transducer with metallopeptidase domain